MIVSIDTFWKVRSDLNPVMRCEEAACYTYVLAGEGYIPGITLPLRHVALQQDYVERGFIGIE